MNSKILTTFTSIMAILVFTISCASTDSKAVKESYTNNPITLNAKQNKVSNLIEKNDNLSKDQKNKLKEIFNVSIMNAKELRERESQLLQQLITNSLKENKNKKELTSLEMALKKLYQKKYKNIEMTIDNIGGVLTGEDVRNDFMSQLHPMDVFYLNGGDR